MRWIPIFLAMGFLVAAGCGGPKTEKAVGDMAAGKAKFEQNCAVCHGTGGKGDGPGAAALNPKPRDYTNASYMKTRSDAELRKVIKEGGAASGFSAVMPPWGGTLSDQDITNVIAYIRSFAK